MQRVGEAGLAPGPQEGLQVRTKMAAEENNTLF